MKPLDPVVSTTTTITSVYELETEDIEEILRIHLKLEGKIDFNWQVGQWVRLQVTQKQTQTQPTSEGGF